LIVTGCVSSISPPPSTLPTNTLAERIAAVENCLPVKKWSKWEEKTVIDRIEYYNVPGVSVAVINNDEIEWSKGYGTLEVGSNKPVTPDTLFCANWPDAH
jgi:CubicO group peptidase (beta-lactamase class C family)